MSAAVSPAATDDAKPADQHSCAQNADAAELAKFANLAHQWWDPRGQFRTLHQLNPLRLDWIVQALDASRAQAAEQGQHGLKGLHVLDVGCGGGLLAEAMARQAAGVLGIDLAEKSLRAAKLHACTDGAAPPQLRYECISVEDLAQRAPASFDVVTCMEMLEHVPHPASVVHACSRLLKPGGMVAFSTLNRSAKAFMQAIVAGEFVLRLLPRGTHSYEKFITPAELQSFGESVGLTTSCISGLRYQPLARRFHLCRDVQVNYLLAMHKTVA